MQHAWTMQPSTLRVSRDGATQLGLAVVGGVYSWPFLLVPAMLRCVSEYRLTSRGLYVSRWSLPHLIQHQITGKLKDKTRLDLPDVRWEGVAVRVPAPHLGRHVAWRPKLRQQVAATGSAVCPAASWGRWPGLRVLNSTHGTLLMLRP